MRISEVQCVISGEFNSLETQGRNRMRRKWKRNKASGMEEEKIKKESTKDLMTESRICFSVLSLHMFSRKSLLR